MKNRNVLAALALIGIVILWWLPSGFNVGALVDDWTMIVWMDEGARPFFYPDIAPTRPLTYTPWIASWALTPGSFVGMNLMLFAAHALKGLLMFRLLRRIAPASFAFGWIGAVLFALFPADHGIFYMGALNIQWNVVLILLAVNLLVDIWIHGRSGRLPLRWIALWLVQLGAVWMYEAGIPLMLCAPLMLLVLPPHPPPPSPLRREGEIAMPAVPPLYVERGLGGEVKGFLLTSLLWTAIPLAWLAYFIYTLTTGSSSYQMSLLDTGAGRWNLISGLGFMLFSNFIMGFGFGAEAGRRALIGQMPLVFLIASSLIGILTAFVAGLPHPPRPLFMWRGEARSPSSELLSRFVWRGGAKAPDHESRLDSERQDDPPFPHGEGGKGGEVNRFWLILIFAGLVAAIIGFAFYIPTSDFSAQQYTWRLSMFTAIGASVAIAAALMLLPRRVTVIAASILIALAALRGMAQHERLRTQSLNQQRILHDIAVQSPAVDEWTAFILFDASGQDATRQIPFNYIMDAAARLLYAQPQLIARICYDDGVSTNPAEVCTFEDGAINVPAIWGGFERIPLEQTVIFQYTPDDRIVLLETIPDAYLNGVAASAYRPHDRIQADSPPPSRLQTLFEYRDIH